jgi:hypothetical protein
MAGTIQRGIDLSKIFEEEIVYPSHVNGSEQIALALSAKIWKKKLKIFTLKSDSRHCIRAQHFGASAELFNDSNMENLVHKAKSYAQKTGACFIPTDFYQDALLKNFKHNLTKAIQDHGKIDVQSYSGTIWLSFDNSKVLELFSDIFPKAHFSCVQLDPNFVVPSNNRITLHKSVEELEEAARILPPYETNLRRDA